MPDDFDGRVPQHVVFTVVQRLTGRHHDGFSGVDAQRVNILHVTHLNKKKESSLTHIVNIIRYLCYKNAITFNRIVTIGSSVIRHLTFKTCCCLFATFISRSCLGQTYFD